MPISLEDLNPKKFLISKEQKSRLLLLASKLTTLEDAFGSLFKITSGFRSREDQICIYHAKGIFDESKIPFGSQHLLGNAADIYDPRGTLKAFLLTDKAALVYTNLGLYFEDFAYAKNWVHIQQVAPSSGRRFFIP